MRLTLAQILLFLATMVASFVPWALKPVGVLIAYYGVLHRKSLNGMLSSVTRSSFFWLTLAYCVTLMFSALLNGSAAGDTLRTAIPILIAPLFAVIASLDERHQRQLLSTFVFAAFVYTFRYAVIFDWSQLLNAEYRGDKDADVFVALNAAFIFVYAFERLILTRQSPNRRVLLYGLAFYGLMIVALIKSRGTLAAMLITMIYLYFRYIVSIRIDRAILFVSALIVAIFTIAATVDFSGIFGAISELLHLTGDGTRSLETGSGRFFVWDYALNVLWSERFWLGYGPRANLELIFEVFKIHGAHNVVVASLLDGGLIATIPILFILLLPIPLYRRNANCVFGYQFYFISLAAALNESLLFAFGNPFAWLSLAMYAQLTSIKKD